MATLDDLYDLDANYKCLVDKICTYLKCNSEEMSDLAQKINHLIVNSEKYNDLPKNKNLNTIDEYVRMKGKY